MHAISNSSTIDTFISVANQEKCVLCVDLHHFFWYKICTFLICEDFFVALTFVPRPIKLVEKVDIASTPSEWERCQFELCVEYLIWYDYCILVFKVCSVWILATHSPDSGEEMSHVQLTPNNAGRVGMCLSHPIVDGTDVCRVIISQEVNVTGWNLIDDLWTENLEFHTAIQTH